MRSFFVSFFFLSLATFLTAQDDNSEIISSVSYIQLKGDKLIRTDSVVLQINDRKGDDEAQIEIFYSKGDKVSIESAYITDQSGNIVRKLKNSEIKDRSAISDISLYEDDFVKSFELKHNVYPYRISYITKSTTSRFIGIYRYRPTVRSIKYNKVTVEASTDSPIKYMQKNMAEPVISNVGEATSYTWTFSQDSFKPEVNMSYESADFPELCVLPQNINFGVKGSFENWQTYGNWIYRLNQNRDVLPGLEKQNIDRLISGIQSDKDKARVLYKYMQDNTRYINVSIKYGGMQTYPADYVCTNRYGDCKALTNYMKAMLKYIGIDSFITAIKSDDAVPEIDSDFPDPGSFNHVILTIPFGNDTTFLECTSKNMPFGYIHSNIQGRKALLTDEKLSRLISVPSMNPNDTKCSKTLEVDVDKINPTTNINLTATERGNSYEILNNISASIRKNNVDMYVRNYIFAGSYDLVNYKFETENRDSAKIVSQINCKMQNLHKIYGNNLILKPFAVNTDRYETPADRKFAVQLDSPKYQQDTVIYSFSEATISKIPENISICSPYGKYNLDYELSDNKLIVRKSVLINAGKYTLEDYPLFYKFIYSIKQNENKNIYLEIL
ncbi:MAG: DUF3857 domain-containing protein [Dysgonomonas sp.]